MTLHVAFYGYHRTARIRSNIERASLSVMLGGRAGLRTGATVWWNGVPHRGTPMPPSVVSLTTEQLRAIMHMAKSVPYHLRRRFLELVADDLRARAPGFNDRHVAAACTRACRCLTGPTYEQQGAA
jgi:hypothetical protein